MAALRRQEADRVAGGDLQIGGLVDHSAGVSSREHIHVVGFGVSDGGQKGDQCGQKAQWSSLQSMRKVKKRRTVRSRMAHGGAARGAHDAPQRPPLPGLCRHCA